MDGSNVVAGLTNPKTYYRLKNGQFVRKKAFLGNQKRLESKLKNKKKSVEKILTEQKQSIKVVEGKRIVDLNVLASNLFCKNCNCDLKLKNIKDEKRTGLHSILSVMCDACKAVTKVETGNKNNGVSENTASIVLGKYIKNDLFND